MPSGSFQGGLTPESRTGSSLTGTGPSSQPKSTGLADQAVSGGGAGQYSYPIGPVKQGGMLQPGSNQYGGPIGPLPGGGMIDPRNPATYTDPFRGVRSLVDTLYGPQQQLLSDQLARQYDQMGMIGTDVRYQSDAARRDNALANQALGLDRQALGLEKNLVAGQQSNLGRLRALLGKQRGLAGEQKGNTLQGLKINEDSARDMAERKTFDLRSDLTARGAYNTVANERGTGRIGRDLDYEIRGINNQRGAADIQFRNQLLGLDEKGIGYDNQALALNNKLANIGLDASRLNLSQQQLNNALADGLYNIGLGGQTSLNGLLDSIGGTNAQQAQMATTILQQIIQYSGLPPDVLAQLNGALGMGGGGGAAPAPRASTNRKTGPGPMLT